MKGSVSTRKERPTKHIADSLNEGFAITHIGVLYWAQPPNVVAKLPVRALFMMLEALFALVFWTMTSRTKDYCMPKLSPWPMSSFKYH